MTTKETPELAPCPFCGSEAVVNPVSNIYDDAYVVVCTGENNTSCCALAMDGYDEDRTEAIHLWNKRTRPPQSTELRELLEEAMENLKSGCELYCRWYDTGHPEMRGKDMAYELVSSMRQAIAKLNAAIQEDGDEQG